MAHQFGIFGGAVKDGIAFLGKALLLALTGSTLALGIGRAGLFPTQGAEGIRLVTPMLHDGEQVKTVGHGTPVKIGAGRCPGAAGGEKDRIPAVRHRDLRFVGVRHTTVTGPAVAGVLCAITPEKLIDGVFTIERLYHVAHAAPRLTRRESCRCGWAWCGGRQGRRCWRRL